MSKLNCHGIGVVIDDKVPLSEDEQTGDAICEIVEQLHSDGISLLKYREIPAQGEWDNFGNVSFLLIDWSLLPSIVGDTAVGDTANKKMKKKICDFIKTIHSKAFAPIFVFSNQDETEIKRYLRDNGIEVDVPNAYVLVRPKSEMNALEENDTPKLFSEINKWIQATPAISLFATWGNEILAARNQMFAEFYSKSHNWPSLLWKAYKYDNDDPAYGLSQVMFDNLKGRVRCNISEMPDVAHDERVQASLKDVLSLTVMLPASTLPENQIGCGDLFKKGSGKFLLVVSCDCDCIIHNGESAESTFVQVVKVDDGCTPENEKMKERFSKDFGLLHQANKSYLFPIGGKCYCVTYSSFKMMKLSEFDMGKRVGRVLPPYITDIRQRLAQWNQRVGFPKLPIELFTAVQAADSTCNTNEGAQE